MQQEPDFLHNLNQEFRDGRRWLDRTIVLAYAAAAGLCVVAFTLMADAGFELFESIYHWQGGWAVLLWMPAVTAGAVWLTRRWAPGAAGSGIPQVIATLDPALDPAQRGRFVSLWLSFAKMALASAGFAAGLSIGREGPSVQVAAGVMHHARRWFGPHSGISHHALLVAGGAAGIAAAFNAPLAGVVSLHGGLGSPLPAQAGGTHPSVLVLNGADDKSVTAEDIAGFQKEMNAAKVDWEFTNYSGAVHCFAERDANSPPGCQYNERAAKRAWKALDEFFEERFR